MSDDDKRAQTAQMAECLERSAKEYAKHSGPSATDRERDTFARDLHACALRYARAYYAEARELGLIPEYAASPLAPTPAPAGPHPTPSPIVIEANDIHEGDVLVAWRLSEGSGWSTIGISGDTRVVSRMTYTARVANGDTMQIRSGNQWKVLRPLQDPPPVVKLTAATITDEQIRELRASGAISESVYEFATAKGWYNRDYREQCAEILNARSAK